MYGIYTKFDRKFRRMHEKYEELTEERIDCSEQYDTMRMEDCSEKELEHYEKIFDKALKKELEYEEKYAKAVFEYLSDEQPMLVQNDNNKQISFGAVFGRKYDELDIKKKRLLTHLLDNENGFYGVV